MFSHTATQKHRRCRPVLDDCHDAFEIGHCLTDDAAGNQVTGFRRRKEVRGIGRKVGRRCITGKQDQVVRIILEFRQNRGGKG